MKLVQFFLALRREKIPSTVSEFLDLLAGLKHNLAVANLDDLYTLSRTCLVKDEKHFDKFDKAFDRFFGDFSGDDRIIDHALFDQKHIERLLKKANVDLADQQQVSEQAEDFLALLQHARQREKAQSQATEDNTRNIQNTPGNGFGRGQGSGGSEGSGARGNKPDAKSTDQSKKTKRKTKKTWQKREYKELDDNEILSTRNIQVALRGLRKYAREGAETELDLRHTISATAKNAGYLDLKMRPERHNKVKVLLLLDIGGSMDPHIRACEALFRAAKSEFKYLQTFYFHNFIYQHVWEKPSRRTDETTDMESILHKYNSDYKVIFVGDGRMADYEITQQYGCVEFANEKTGEQWMNEVTEKFRKVAWLNPLPKNQWSNAGSIKITQDLVSDHMYPMSLQGLEQAMKHLN